MTNQDYKNTALAALKGNWAPAVLATIVFMFISISIYGIQYLFLGENPDSARILATYPLIFLIMTPLELGYINSILKFIQEGDREITVNIFKIAFNGKYLHNVLCMLVMSILCIIASFLLFIPGIILELAYAMVPFIVVKHPELSIKETLKKSRMMMKGYKFDFFYLLLSFLGWDVLSLLTLGIGFLWLMPYMTGAVCAFWEEVYEQSIYNSEV